MDTLDLQDLLIGIPEGVANMQLPDIYLRDCYLDEVNRVFRINKQIDDNTMDLLKLIEKCNKEDINKPIEERKRILVMIDSVGGAVDVDQAIVGAMKISKTPIYTCCCRRAYSAAADILACGHKRFAFPFTNIMFHAGSGCYEGTQAQIDSAKKFFDKVGSRLNNEVFSRVKFTPKMIKRLKTEDVFMTEEEALEYGVIDAIITDFDELI